jgi:hypothetical protein
MKANTSFNLSIGTEDLDTILNSRGVYGIHNRETGGIYIGSTNRYLKNRLLEHKNDLDAHKHDNWRMMEDYKPEDVEVRILAYTDDNNVPEYVIQVLEQIAISAFPMDILYNQNIVYPKQRQIEYLRLEHKELLYYLVQQLRNLYAWQVNQCIAYKKPARMLLSTLVLGGDLKLLNIEEGILLSSVTK